MLLFFTYYSLIVIRTISSAPVSWPNYRTVLGHQGILELYHKSLGRDVSVKRSISSPGWPSYSTLFAFICWMIILTLFLFIHCSGLYSKLLWMMWLQYKPLHFVWIPHHPLLIHCLLIAYPLLIHCLFIDYPLLIHCLFTAYSLLIRCLFIAYSLLFHCLFIAYS